ncbi:hypothetical protein Tco_1294829 [Tanacetum coccineum]
MKRPLRNDQMQQTFEKISLAMTHKLDDIIELPKSLPKKTIKRDLECEMVMVKLPRCMSWPGSTDAYDEPICSLCMMDKELGDTSLQITLQILPSFEEYTPLVTYLEEVEETLGTPVEELFLGEDATRAIPNMGFNLVDVEGFLYLEIEVVCVEFGCYFEVELECEQYDLVMLDWGDCFLEMVHDELVSVLVLENCIEQFDMFQRIGYFLQRVSHSFLSTLNGFGCGLIGDVFVGMIVMMMNVGCIHSGGKV